MMATQNSCQYCFRCFLGSLCRPMVISSICLAAILALFLAFIGSRQTVSFSHDLFNYRKPVVTRRILTPWDEDIKKLVTEANDHMYFFAVEILYVAIITNQEELQRYRYWLCSSAALKQRWGLFLVIVALPLSETDHSKSVLSPPLHYYYMKTRPPDEQILSFAVGQERMEIVLRARIIQALADGNIGFAWFDPHELWLQLPRDLLMDYGVLADITLPHSGLLLPVTPMVIMPTEATQKALRNWTKSLQEPNLQINLSERGVIEDLCQTRAFGLKCFRFDAKTEMVPIDQWLKMDRSSINITSIDLATLEPFFVHFGSKPSANYTDAVMERLKAVNFTSAVNNQDCATKMLNSA